MKNTAWKEGDDEIETYEQESTMTKVVFAVIILVIAVGFIVGQIIINNL